MVRIISIEIKYADVTTHSDNEDKFLPIGKIFNFEYTKNKVTLEGKYETEYYGDEIWLPGIIREIEGNL